MAALRSSGDYAAVAGGIPRAGSLRVPDELVGEEGQAVANRRCIHEPHRFRFADLAEHALAGADHDPRCPKPTRYGEAIWLEPYADALLEGVPDQAPGPEARYEVKEAIGLAFIVGLQHLPPQQRAVLVLRDVLGFRAGEVAEMLQTTAQSVNSLLRRARAAFDSRLPATGRERAPAPNSKLEREIVGRFADAIEAGDADAVVALLTDDAWLTMPPEPYEYQGRSAIGAFLADRTARRGAPRLVATRANTQPAFGCYFASPETEIARPDAIVVLGLTGDRISAITWFGASGAFPQCGPPQSLRYLKALIAVAPS